MIVSSLILGLLSFYAVNYLHRLSKNIQLARRTKLPYIVLPISGNTSIPLKVLCGFRWVADAINRYLPTWLADIVNDTVYDFRWTVKDRRAKELGNVYLIVTAQKIDCHVADASVVTQICNARQNFPKPIWQYKILDLYGPNLVTCEDQAWAHHRRHTAPPFNEKNNALVWQESIRQTTEMIDYWQRSHSPDGKPGFVVAKIRDDTLNLTLNVLSGAGFGVKLPFKPSFQNPIDNSDDIFQDTAIPPTGFSFTFRSVMAYMNVNIPTVVLANIMLPKWIPRSLLPWLKRDFEAHQDLKTYLQRLITAAASEKTADSSSNLIKGLLLSRTQNAEDKATKDPGLTDLEIIGNMHIFTIAGHETTAASLRFALLLLALHQDAQDWLYESIVVAAQSEPADVAKWNYSRLFPKLIAPLCVMLETLRLYPPVVTVPKSTSEHPHPLVFQGKEHILPPSTNVNLNASCLHYLEEYWGPDATEFHPQRWDARNQESFLAKNALTPGLVGPGLEYATVYKPPRGAFIPFSDGFRACLGKKFAQVEFVAVLAVLFRDYKVELADDGPAARLDAERVLRESVSVLTLAMRENIPLRVRRRKNECEGI